MCCKIIDMCMYSLLGNTAVDRIRMYAPLHFNMQTEKTIRGKKKECGVVNINEFRQIFQKKRGRQ